jgi:hypothetical protein
MILPVFNGDFAVLSVLPSCLERFQRLRIGQQNPYAVLWTGLLSYGGTRVGQYGPSKDSSGFLLSCSKPLKKPDLGQQDGKDSKIAIKYRREHQSCSRWSSDPTSLDTPSTISSGDIWAPINRFLGGQIGVALQRSAPHAH